MFGAFGNFAALMKQAQQISSKLEDLGQDLKSRRVTGSAGGGMVEIEANGLQEVIACRIDPSLFSQGDRELLEDLIRGATNQALTKAKQMHAEAMKDLAGGASMPGLQEALAKLAGDAGGMPGT